MYHNHNLEIYKFVDSLNHPGYSYDAGSNWYAYTIPPEDTRHWPATTAAILPSTGPLHLAATNVVPVVRLPQGGNFPGRSRALLPRLRKGAPTPGNRT